MKIKPIKCTATNNQIISIPDNSKKIILYFYPKDNTPGCTKEGEDFRDNHHKFITNNCIIYGVSRDSLKKHENFKKKYNFPFELISDEQEKLCNMFNVIKLKKLYGREYMGIDRSTFIIDRDGSILREWRKVKITGHIDEVLSAIKLL